MRCATCPAGWEEEYKLCGDYGCVIYGHRYQPEQCELSAEMVQRRLKQWEEYLKGERDRPKWVESRYFREMDMHNEMFGDADIDLPEFPPKKMVFDF